MIYTCSPGGVKGPICVCSQGKGGKRVKYIHMFTRRGRGVKLGGDFWKLPSEFTTNKTIPVLRPTVGEVLVVRQRLGNIQYYSLRQILNNRLDIRSLFDTLNSSSIILHKGKWIYISLFDNTFPPPGSFSPAPPSSLPLMTILQTPKKNLKPKHKQPLLSKQMQSYSQRYGGIFCHRNSIKVIKKLVYRQLKLRALRPPAPYCVFLKDFFVSVHYHVPERSNKKENPQSIWTKGLYSLGTAHISASNSPTVTKYTHILERS